MVNTEMHFLPASISQFHHLQFPWLPQKQWPHKRHCFKMERRSEKLEQFVVALKNPVCVFPAKPKHIQLQRKSTTISMWGFVCLFFQRWATKHQRRTRFLRIVKSVSLALQWRMSDCSSESVLSHFLKLYSVASALTNPHRDEQTKRQTDRQTLCLSCFWMQRTGWLS